jgi:hypothetical protein
MKTMLGFPSFAKASEDGAAAESRGQRAKRMRWKLFMVGWGTDFGQQNGGQQN